MSLNSKTGTTWLQKLFLLELLLARTIRCWDWEMSFCLFRKKEQNSINLELTFWKTSTSFVPDFLQTDFIGVVAINTMRISSFNDSHAFNQSDLGLFSDR